MAQVILVIFVTRSPPKHSAPSSKPSPASRWDNGPPSSSFQSSPAQRSFKSTSPKATSPKATSPARPLSPVADDALLSAVNNISTTFASFLQQQQRTSQTMEQLLITQSKSTTAIDQIL